ncbi:NB-ARC domains-containing protein [Tanacetum coccineum]
MVLFKRVIGEIVEVNAKLKPIAMKVAQGCGGLPLILNAVENALKYQKLKEWEKAVNKIEKHATLDIDPAIKLTLYGVGLELFKDLNLEDARDKVESVWKTLKSCCLLLDGYDEFTTKMHDVVREVAFLIVLKDDNKFVVEAGNNLTQWEPRIGSLEDYMGISLMSNDIGKLPDYELHIPMLKSSCYSEDYMGISLMINDIGRLHDYELHIPMLKIFLIQRNPILSQMSNEFTRAIKQAQVSE